MRVDLYNWLVSFTVFLLLMWLVSGGTISRPIMICQRLSRGAQIESKLIRVEDTEVAQRSHRPTDSSKKHTFAV